MSTLNRRNSEKRLPDYKDYVNFVSAYRNGKQTMNDPSQGDLDSKTSNPLTQGKVESYSKFLERTNSKKFVSVKPPIAAKKTIKTEIFLEINGEREKKPIVKTIKLFENQNTDCDKEEHKCVVEKKQNWQTALNNSLNGHKNSVISFDDTDRMEKNSKNIARRNGDEISRIDKAKQSLFNESLQQKEEETIPSSINRKVLPPLETVPKQVVTKRNVNLEETTCYIPPPPAMPTTQFGRIQTKKIQENGSNKPKISEINPLVKKLAYGAMLDMYGAYHDKANNFVATLPRNQVKKDSNLQKIINNIAAQGGLEKLSGRTIPKDEIECKP